MCLSVRIALTPPYVQVMQRKTSLSQEQGLAGSNPALHTIYTSDATGRHLRLRTGVLRVRVPPCVSVCAFGSIGRAPGCGPGGWRFKSAPSPHGTLAQSVESQTENLFAQVRFLEVPQSENGRQELHCCMEFLRPFFETPFIFNVRSDC